MSHVQHAHVPRFGYRGRALTLVGLVWVLVGVKVLRDPGGTPYLDHLPTWLRLSVWGATGGVALVTAWWPAGADRYGFMALSIPATIRTLANGWSWLLGIVTGNQVGNSGDWVSAVAWAAIVAFVLLLASWPEPVTNNGGEES